MSSAGHYGPPIPGMFPWDKKSTSQKYSPTEESIGMVIVTSVEDKYLYIIQVNGEVVAEFRGDWHSAKLELFEDIHKLWENI